MLQSKNAIRLRNDGICQYSHHETAYLDNNETFCRHSWKHTSFVARSSSTKQFASQPVSLLLFLCIAVFASAKEYNKIGNESPAYLAAISDCSEGIISKENAPGFYDERIDNIFSQPSKQSGRFRARIHRIRYTKNEKTNEVCAIILIHLFLNDSARENEMVQYKRSVEAVMKAAQPSWTLVHMTAKPTSETITESVSFNGRASNYMSGTDSLNATYGYIASPNFPGPYEPDNKLSWEMASSDTQNGQVRITIVALNLAYNAETRTCLDYIEIYDRNTRRYKFCQLRDLPKSRVVTSSFPNVRVTFTSGKKQRYENFGFLLHWQTKETKCNPNPCLNGGICETDKSGFASCRCPVTHAGVFCDISAECGGIIEAEQLGKVQSPYYPVGYTPGSICRWIISAPFDHIVYFELVKVFLDNPAECKDFITVSQSSPLMTQVAITKRYCGDKVTGRMQSEFDTLDIKLTCNSGLSFPGFVLTYEIAPNFCLSNPCNDNQICTNNHEWFVCTCKPGYTGSNCEDKIDYCAFVSCLNQGTCVSKESSYECLCAEGFTGIHCEADVCENYEGCYNKGVCKIGDDGHPTCNCPHDYIGDDCSIPRCGTHEADYFTETNGSLRSPRFPLERPSRIVCIYHFRSNTINNVWIFKFPKIHLRGYYYDQVTIHNSSRVSDDSVVQRISGDNDNLAVLVQSPNAMIILSARSDLTSMNYGFSLNFARKKNPCTEVTCVGNHVCIPTVDGHKCMCALGYTGHDCSKKIDLCSPSPCQNGGACKMFEDQYKCLCPSRFTGPHCQYKIDPCAEQPCQNSGVCVAAGDDFRCECVAPYYFGRTCEIVNCTNISVTGHSGFITTPGYPLVDYLANASCSWEFLHGSSIMSYTFMFTTFSVEGPSRTCDNDYLEIIASGRNSGLRFCGKMKNRLLTLSGPAKMRFVTNEIIQEKGFNVTYQYSLIGLCNSTLTTNEGHFFLPSAEIYKRFKGDICIWRIHPEKNKQIELSISVGGNVTGEDYYVEIYDSFDQVDKHMIAKISDRNGGTFSISNTASVKMLIPSQEVLKFSAFYKTEDIVHCDTLNCPTNSSCKMKDSVVFCACDDGHTNDRGSCSNVTCRDFVCQNGGKCNYDKFFGASCICRANFSGTHCEKDDLCDVHPCHPTGGACFHEHGQPICVCHPGFTGKFCSEKFPAFRCGGLVDEFPYGITLATNNQNGPCEWHLRPSSQRHVILINLDRIDFGPDCLNGELVILDMWKNVLLRLCKIPLENPLVLKRQPIIVKFEATTSSIARVAARIFLGENLCENATIQCPEHSECHFNTTTTFCLCDNNYTGDNCNQKIEPCANVNCHNGSCVSTEDNAFKCVCKPQFSGTYCEEELNACMSQPCQNGGTCYKSSYGYQCLCTKGYYGKNCQKEFCKYHLKGSSGVITSARFPNKYANNLACSWKITAPSHHFISLRISEMDIEGVPGKCSYDSLKIYDGENSGAELLLSACGRANEHSISVKSRHLGGTVSLLFTSDSSISGNGFKVIWNATHEKCLDKQCPTNSACVVTANDELQCICDSNSIGSSCEAVNLCKHITCDNGGLCQKKPGDFSCICPPEFTGKFCDIDVNECLSSPCNNEGSCINDYGGFHCICLVGFTGRLCEEAVHHEIVDTEAVIKANSSVKIAQWRLLSKDTTLSHVTVEIVFLNLSRNQTIRISEGNKNYCTESEDLAVLSFGAKHAQTVTSYGNSLVITFMNRENIFSEPVEVFMFYIRWDHCPPGLYGSSCAYKSADEFEVCDWKIISQLNGKLFHRNPYGRRNCSTTINFGFERKVDLKFLQLEFGSSSDVCSHGYVELFEGSAGSGKTLGKFCHQPFGLSLQTKLLSLVFISGNVSKNQNLRFEMLWNSEFDDIAERGIKTVTVPEGSASNSSIKSEENKRRLERTFDISLSKVITAESGYLTSPDFPKLYLPNQKFAVAFIGDNTSVFLFELLHTRLEEPNAHGYCYDALLVYDSMSLSMGKQLKVACGNESSTVISQQNVVTVLFRTDSSVESTGFRLHFRQVYNRCIIHKCPPHSHCINTADSYRCECDIGYAGTNCEEVIDYCDNSPCLERGVCTNEPDGYCCLCNLRYTGAACQFDRSCPENYCLHKGICHDDPTGKSSCSCDQPFYGQFCEKSNCTKTEISAERSVRSLNFPQKYPANVQCTWTFETPNQDQVFLITMKRADIDCPGDLLRLDLGMNESVKICEESQTTYFSRGNQVSFAFSSDGFNERRGFDAHIKAVTDKCKNFPCPKNSVCKNVNSGIPECSCEHDFTAQNCETSTQPCDEHPCMHNSVCENVEFRNFVCKCENGFTGKRCEIASNPCLPNPCLNGGICEWKGNDDYSCNCFLPTAGKHCERCVEHREVAEGEVVSFGYPTGYSSNLTCGWILRRDLEDNHFTSGIFLNITEVAVDTSFNHDYLEILGSNGSQLMLIELSKYSGNSMENSFFLKDPKVSVILHSGYKGNGARHFRFNFYESFDYCSAYPCMNGGVCRNNLHTRRVHGRTCECQTEQFHGYSCETRDYFKCGQLLAKQAIANGIIATAQFPRPYERSNCSWAIRVPEGSVIAIEFHTLDTNRHCRHCCHHASYVQIEDEGDSSHAKRFCGNSVPPLFYTMSNQVVVKLIVSLTAHSGIGFLLTYDAIINKCINSTCHHNQTCVLDRAGEAVCLCSRGYDGELCEKEVNLCETEDVMCKNNGSCISSNEKWMCQCMAGFSGNLCEDDIWCKESSCSYQGKCEHDTNGPKCNCYPGFTGTSCEQVVCGGIITDREGIIRSPQNSTGTSAQHYFKGASCLWNFTVSGDSCVHLLFDFVDLRSDYANYKICDPERLDIYYLDTFTGGKQLLRSLCDEDDQIEIVSPSDNLIIDYKTVKDADYEHLGFLVRYQIDINDCTADKCGGNTICVDAFNSSYRCACKPGFTGPNCETKYSACSHFKPCKFGECTDSSDTFICVCEAGYTGKLCDIKIDHCASSPCVHGRCISLRTRYTCDCFDYGNYFAYGLNCENIMCLPVRLSEENGEIQSPFYPGAYPSNLNCSWILDFQYNRILALTFDQVSLGPANCSQDYIDIFYGIGTSVNGSGAAERLCGQQKGEHRFVIPFPSVKIVLITGNLTTHSSGFHLTYRAEVPSICNTYLCNTGTCHVLSSGDPICQCPEGVFGEHCEIEPKIKCNSRLTEATGSFVLSTGNSSEGTECGLEISPYAVARLTERKVYLRVLFSTLQPAECNENYLEINVVEESQIIPTETTRMCSTVTGLESDEMSFPRSPIKLRLKTNGTAHAVALSYSIDFCEVNRVTCRGESRCVNTMNAEQPFKCLCPRHSADIGCSCPCQDHTLPGEAGWFSSPNHPRDYPHDINCSWTISTPGSPVEVVFDFIDLEGKYPECTSDYIEIMTRHNGSTRQRTTRLCGEWTDQKFISLSGEVQVTLHSDSFISGKGFAARYNSVDRPCSHFECLNGGTCKATPDIPEPVCVCQRGYDGRFCERRIRCPANYCLNGGTCYMADSYPSCICTVHFAGNRCQQVLCDQLHYSGTDFSLAVSPSEGSSPANCSFYLTGPKSMPISVLVNELQVDNGDCTNGLIEVYEGFFPAKQALISKFCNLTSMPALIGTNTSNEILLVARIYKWTSATTVKGKVLRDFSCNSALCKNAACVQESNTIKCDCTGGYGGPTCQEPLCGQIILHKEQGTVQSYLPSMNDPFSYCFYAIISQQQSIIFIYLFTYIPDKAPANAILAFDGPDETYDNVDLSRQESTFLSKGNAFSILLTLANEDESEYDPPSFEVMYTEVPLEVGVNNSYGEISSFDPAFGEFNRLERNFTISVSKAKSIFVNFLYFNVGSCNHSSVSIHYNGNWTRLCGDKTGWSKKFNTNILRIRLEFTKYVDEYQGFTANYTTSETQKEKEGDRLFYGHKERILT